MNGRGRERTDYQGYIQVLLDLMLIKFRRALLKKKKFNILFLQFTKTCYDYVNTLAACARVYEWP